MEPVAGYREVIIGEDIKFILSMDQRYELQDEGRRVAITLSDQTVIVAAKYPFSDGEEQGDLDRLRRPLDGFFEQCVSKAEGRPVSAVMEVEESVDYPALQGVACVRRSESSVHWWVARTCCRPNSDDFWLFHWNGMSLNTEFLEVLHSVQLLVHP